MTIERRYLPLFREDGAWIERPDLYIFARIAQSDKEDDNGVEQAYEFMRQANNSEPELNSIEKRVKKHLHGIKKVRRNAAVVLWTLVCLKANTGERPTILAACRLAANEEHRSTRRSSVDSFERDFIRAFSLYRNTAHLQAAAFFMGKGFEEIELGPEKLDRFLGFARGLEEFMDREVCGPRLRWNPWRVPESIPLMPKIEIPKLSDEHLSWSKVS